MRTLFLASTIVFIMAPGPIRSDEVKDQEPLQGTWKIVSIKSKGKDAELNLVLVVKATDRGMCLKQPEQEQKEQFRFVIDPAVTPKAIDASTSRTTRASGPRRSSRESSRRPRRS